MHSPPSWPGAGLVLVAPGGLPAADGSPARLAALLGLRLLAPAIDAAADPDAVLAALAAEPPGWLLPLPLDPGGDLDGPGCWAEALAAWRQPVLLLLPLQAQGGAPRAYQALLQSLGAPLVGLVQACGPWPEARRRRDGLPWLGWLPGAADGPAGPEDDGDDPAAALRATTLARWQRISGARPDPPLPHPPA